MWAIFGDSGSFWGRSKSRLFHILGNDGLQEALGVDFGSISTRFGKHLGTDLDAFGWVGSRFETPRGRIVRFHISYRNPLAASLRPAKRHNFHGARRNRNIIAIDTAMLTSTLLH